MAKVKTPDAVRFAHMVGANMKYLRLIKSPFCPQKVLAGQIGISFQQVQKYESGKNIPCSYRLAQIADFFKVSVNDLVNPSYIYEQTKGNELLDKGLTLQDVVDKKLTPQDAGYLKPQKDIGSLEEIKEDKDWIVANNLTPKILVGSLKEIKDELLADGIDPEETILPTLRNAAKKELN